jgi:hypothetical protein
MEQFARTARLLLAFLRKASAVVGNGGTAGSFGVAAPVGIGVGGGGFGVERQLGDTAVFGFSAAAAVRPIPYPTVQPVA